VNLYKIFFFTFGIRKNKEKEIFIDRNKMNFNKVLILIKD